MKVLITGAAGDFGRDLVPWLAKKHEVVCTDARECTTPFEFRKADLCDISQVTGLCEGVQAVIHLAALLPKSEHPTQAYLSANVEAVALLAEEAIRAGVKRFIYVSTVWATGHGTTEGVFRIDELTPPRPVCMYGITKYQGELLAEYYARNHGLSTIVLRATGYLRHEAFDAEGNIDWEQADLASIASRITTPGAKPYNPGDLGLIFDAALGLPEVESERLLIGLTSPFTDEDAALCQDNPIAAWEKYYPGAAEFFAATGHQPPPFTHLYDNTRSRDTLGFEMQYDLGDVISAWRLQEGPR
ncbi:MAG: NAD-dependent epimerase/dehydratase family protein [Armatimonadota bacterium]